MRQRDHLNPEEMRELDALDRVLAGEPVDADLRELEDLVLDIRENAPQMTPAFAAALEQEVSEGFPMRAQGSRPRPRPQPRPRRRWMLVPAAGTLAAVAIALVAVIGPNDDGAVNTPAMSSRAEPGAALEDLPATAAAPAPPEDMAAQPGAGSGSPGRGAVVPRPDASRTSSARQRPSGAPATTTAARKVERNAVLVLESPDDEVESTADAVIRTVDRFGGIVQSSSSSSGDGSDGEATFDLRIPTVKLDEALAALSKLGHVAERSQNLQDITRSFTSAQDRLADARAERRGLLRALGRATTPVRIESLRSRLRLVRGTIARRDGELRSLRRRADLSTVQLTIRGTGKSDEGAAGGQWTPGDAAADAVRVLEVIAGVGVIVLAIAAPFTPLGMAIVLGVRVGRRRRREGALGTG